MATVDATPFLPPFLQESDVEHQRSKQNVGEKDFSKDSKQNVNHS